MTQEFNSIQERKNYSPIKVSLLGSISELTQAGGFSGGGGGGKKGGGGGGKKKR